MRVPGVLARPHGSSRPSTTPHSKEVGPATQRGHAKAVRILGTFFPPHKVARVGNARFTLSLVRLRTVLSPSADWSPPIVGASGGGWLWPVSETPRCIHRPRCSEPSGRPPRLPASRWGATLRRWWCREPPSPRAGAACRICLTTCRPSPRLRRPPLRCTCCPSFSRCSRQRERGRLLESPHQ